MVHPWYGFFADIFASSYCSTGSLPWYVSPLGHIASRVKCVAKEVWYVYCWWLLRGSLWARTIVWWNGYYRTAWVRLSDFILAWSTPFPSPPSLSSNLSHTPIYFHHSPLILLFVDIRCDFCVSRCHFRSDDAIYRRHSTPGSYQRQMVDTMFWCYLYL